MLKQTSILSIPFSQGSKNQILEEIGKILSSEQKSHYIVTPNPEIVVAARNNSKFKNALKNASLSLADGVGITFAAKLLEIEAINRLPGVDLVDILCREAVTPNSKWSKKPIMIGFLGGREQVAEKTAECLIKKYPELSVVYIDDEWGPDGFEKAVSFQDPGTGNQDLKIKIKESGFGNQEKRSDGLHKKHHSQNTNHIDILFVAFGSPKQEIWMDENREKIPATLMVGVGGAFDMISGKVSRAPGFVRSLGLEWLYRLLKQPWRLKRQLALPVFVYLVFKEKFFA